MVKRFRTDDSRPCFYSPSLSYHFSIYNRSTTVKLCDESFGYCTSRICIFYFLQSSNSSLHKNVRQMLGKKAPTKHIHCFKYWLLFFFSVSFDVWFVFIDNNSNLFRALYVARLYFTIVISYTIISFHIVCS